MKANIALVKGDGIGPEVVNATLLVLDKIATLYGHTFNYVDVIAGGIAIDTFGEPLPAESLNQLKCADAVIMGALGGPKWDNCPKRPENALLAIRKELNLFANLRPAKLYSALQNVCPLKNAKDIDLIVVRELTGGIYYGKRGLTRGKMGLVAYDTESYAELEIERIARVAYELAQKRRKHLTSVDKANILDSSRLWRKVVHEINCDYPDVKVDDLYVDNASMQLIRNPEFFDVIVTSNMFGDILSDEASMLAGSMGMLPSASINDTPLGVYEPVHGSAPDIAGQNIANPIATILSASMMLEQSFNLNKEAQAINTAVEKVLNDYRTVDIMEDGKIQLGTIEMAEKIASEITKLS